MRTELKITADGSKTLFVPELNEPYHSINGAVQESMHVFINAGLKQINKNEISIFEMGFGTGLNALLTLINGNGFKKIKYHTVELFPIDTDLAIQMAYCEFLKLDRIHTGLFKEIHSCPWNIDIEITSTFSIKKIQASLLNIELIDKYNLVYFDAFAPNVQPELWTEDIFSKIYKAMNSVGILITYCAKGDVRRAMLSCGFQVEKLPGPPGKLHMLRAMKKE